uniref:Uncharacterized protein n=1 Tax=Glossina pallidipes TaxID=7398 RepID=A0A1B0AJU2_GLOPL
MPSLLVIVFSENAITKTRLIAVMGASKNMNSPRLSFMIFDNHEWSRRISILEYVNIVTTSNETINMWVAFGTSILLNMKM